MALTAPRDVHFSQNDLQQTNTRLEKISKQRKLRIGIFTESYPPVVNGVTTSVLTLIDQLERMGHTVIVFCPRYPGHKGDPSNVVRFPSILTPFDRGYPLPVPFSRDLMSAVAKHKLDIIHTHVPFMLGLVALMVARAEGKPLVATNHTLYTEYSHYMPVVPPEITKGVTRSMVRWYYERCDAVIAPSQMAAGRLTEGYGIHRTLVKVVPTGIPVPEPFSPEVLDETRKRYGVADDELLLLFAGRIAKEKNLNMLLDAYENVVLPRHPKTRLVLAGSGVYVEAIRERIQESPKLRKHAVLTGFINRPEMDPLYAAADLFVFPSFTETQGVVLGEALAVGTPCCAVNAAGSPETVTNNVDGLLTDNNAEAFGAAINRLIDDTALRNEMSVNALRLAEERTPEKMAHRIVNVYRAARKRVTLRRANAVFHTPPPAELFRKRIFPTE